MDSNCCKAPLRVQHGEDCAYYVCEACDFPADPYQPPDDAA